MLHSELTEKIIACAYTVYDEMRYGYLELVYERRVNKVVLVLNFAKIR